MEKTHKPSSINSASRVNTQPFFNFNSPTVEAPFFSKSPSLIQRKLDSEDTKDAIVVKVDSKSDNFKNIYRIGLYYGVSQDAIIELNKQNNPNFDATDLKNGEEVLVPKGGNKVESNVDKKEPAPFKNSEVVKQTQVAKPTYSEFNQIIIDYNKRYVVADALKVAMPQPTIYMIKDDSIQALLRKPILTPEEIKKVIQYANNLTDDAEKKETFLLLQSKVEYINQRNSMSEEVEEEYSDPEKKGAKKGESVYAETSSGGMCNLSSLAMALQNLGTANPNPNLLYQDALEEVRVKLKLEKLSGVGTRRDWSTWVAIAKHLGAKGSASISLSEKKSKKWYLDNFLPDLQNGAGIMLSFEGHVVRLENVTDSGFIIDDPYGKMNPVKREENNGGGWDATNSKRGEKENKIVGKDNVWTWEQIEKIALKGYTVVKY